MAFNVQKPSRLDAVRLLRHAKRDSTPTADVDAALAFLVRSGWKDYDRAASRLKRYGFDDTEVQACLDQAYPAFPPPPPGP